MAGNEKEKKQIFRQQSLDRIASPEQLSDYLHVTNPSIWLIFTVILLIIIGLFAWSTLYNLESVLDADASVKDGVAVMALPDTDYYVKTGMTARIGNEEFTISSVQVDNDGFIMVYVPVNLPNGVYDAVIVVESMKPIEFLFKM